MKAQINRIATNRIEAIKLNPTLSTAPVANTELINFIASNREVSALKIMQDYKKALLKLQLEVFKNN